MHHTNVVHEWNEKIAFIGTFPSLSQTFIFDVIASDCCHRRVVAGNDLQFSNLTKQIDSICRAMHLSLTIIEFHPFFSISDRFSSNFWSVLSLFLPRTTECCLRWSFAAFDCHRSRSQSVGNPEKMPNVSNYGTTGYNCVLGGRTVPDEARHF